MKTTINLNLLPKEERDESLIRKKIAKILNVSENQITGIIFKKKSIDARRGKLKLSLVYTVYVDEEVPEEEKMGTELNKFTPKWQKISETIKKTKSKDVIIVGSGPAGLFSALRLLEHGFRPIIIERGEKTPERKKDIALISRLGSVDENSNYCFGEGGAGTFSDGKLYTRSNKRGDIARILSLFVHHGADPSILTDAHPHIGTEKLPNIITRMRETIESHGGEFHFSTKCIDFDISDGRIKGVRAQQLKTGTELVFEGRSVILATGHSARDVYALLERIDRKNIQAIKNLSSVPILEAKTFAVGVRVEHPRSLIDAIQYHGNEDAALLGAAEYRLVTQIEGRGVYSFCMCPGGFIVPSATASDQIVVNGMSSSKRNSRWSNAAFVVETKPEDIPLYLSSVPKNSVLLGLFYQDWLEKEAKKQGLGQKAPAQRMKDFIEGRYSETLPSCSYAPGLVSSRLDLWLPLPLVQKLQVAFAEFNKCMRGFIAEDALLVAVETRTSSPVRIVRDKENLECLGLKGLYPAGEGSGYAGGIVSSAMDGERVADSIARMFE